MSDWREKFKEAYVAAIWRNGSVVRQADTYYGWQDYEPTMHIYSCELAEASNPIDDEWDAFVGTFDGSVVRHGVSMVASCVCGQVKDRTIRWDAPVGEVITEVLRAAE